MLRQVVGLLAVLAFFCPGQLCFSQTPEAASAVTGSLTYRQRPALPPDAVIDVSLEDVSLADAPAKILVLQIFSADGRQSPIPFQLKYDAGQIIAGHRYQVQAKIVSEGQTIFTTTAAYPVITDGAPTDLTLMLDQVTPPPGTASETPAAASAIPSQSSASQQSPSQPVQSQQEMTPPAPDSAPAPSGLSATNVTLDGTYWKLIVLDGKPAIDGVANSEANLLLHAKGNRLAGFSGCNRVAGTYESKGDSIHFKPAGATLMACSPPLRKQEQQFLAALKSATMYRIQLQTLELMDGEDVLAVFHAKYLK